MIVVFNYELCLNTIPTKFDTTCLLERITYNTPSNSKYEIFFPKIILNKETSLINEPSNIVFAHMYIIMS